MSDIYSDDFGISAGGLGNGWFVSLTGIVSIFDLPIWISLLGAGAISGCIFVV